MRFTADKLVYIDFNDIIFANLYIGKDSQSKSYYNSSLSDDFEDTAQAP